MKRLPVILAALVLFSQACSKKTDNDSKADTTSVVRHSPVNQCFVYQENKDSAFLHLQIADNSASGALNYFLHEKDSNRGRLQGQLSGDTLFAKYTFTSEGQESVREIALLRKGSEWIEGFGDPEEKNGMMVFKNHASIRFDQSLRFKETSCP